MDDNLVLMANNLGISVVLLAFLILIIATWSMVWKLLGMWKAAKRNSSVWFVVLALFNTIGILPILYIYVFSKMNLKTKPKNKKSSKKKVKKKKK